MELSITYDLADDDMKAFRTHFLLTSAFARRQTRKWQLFLSVVGVLAFSAGVFLIVAADRGEGAFAFGLFATVYGLGYLIYLVTYFPKRYHKKWLRHMQKVDRAHPVNSHYGRHTATILDSIVKFSGPIGTSEVPIDRLHEVIDEGDHVYLFTDGQSAVIVPKNKVVDGNVDEFLAYCQNVRRSTPPMTQE